MEQPPTTTNPAADQIAGLLHTIAQYVLIATLGLLPIFFIPTAASTIGNAKVLFVAFGSFIALIFLSLATLRSGTLQFGAPRALLALWGVVLATLVSALLSGDVSDALVGNFLEVHTVGFIALMAFVTTLVSILLNTKVSIMRLYSLLTISTAVLSVYHLVRIVFGPAAADLGVFTSSVASPLGSWNDLGLFFGFITLIALVAIEQLPLTKWGRAFVFGVLSISLVMLAIINFFAVWIVLGISSLMLLMYGLTKNRFQPDTLPLTGQQTQSPLSIMTSALVFIVSVVFVIGGSFVGGAIAQLTNVSYVEVRPSLEATLDIGRSVYSENMFTGIGPNKFADAWRLYKDRAINDTIFWNTDFTAGNGYLTTQFVNTGLLGTVLWLVFLGLLGLAGLRMLFRATHVDRFWYYIGTSSFVTAVYLWGMFFLYVPGATMLLLAAISTGIVAVSYVSLLPENKRYLSVAVDRRSAFALIAVSMAAIIVSVGTMYWTGRQYYTEYAFAAAVQDVRPGQSIEVVEQRIADVFELNQNDRFASQIALYQLARLNTLLALENPTAEQQQQFQNAIANGINAAEQAIAIDPSEPRHHAALGSIYSVLATAGVEGSRERSEEALARARALDPRNPEYALLEAQLLARLGEIDAAREKVLEAIRLKRNYTDALYFSSQLEIAAGNTQAAIEATQAMVSLEPRNAARQYQLGVLYTAEQNLDAAVAAFERAVALDRNYANARYFLALAYVEQGRLEAALEQLEVVRELNPNNQEVAALIAQIQAGEVTAAIPENIISEPEGQLDEGDAIVTPTDVPDTDLLTPVNTAPAANTAEETASVDETTSDSESLPDATEAATTTD